ncbi:AAEL009797-PA, partial [Aedes aegypti]
MDSPLGHFETYRSFRIEIQRNSPGHNIESVSVVSCFIATTNRSIGIFLAGKVHQHVQNQSTFLVPFVKRFIVTPYVNHSAQKSFAGKISGDLGVPLQFVETVQHEVGHIHGPIGRKRPRRVTCRIQFRWVQVFSSVLFHAEQIRVHLGHRVWVWMIWIVI